MCVIHAENVTSTGLKKWDLDFEKTWHAGRCYSSLKVLNFYVPRTLPSIPTAIIYHIKQWYIPHYKSPTALSHMHHLTCGISSLPHSVNLILFTVLLVHLILRISPHHSHHLRSHHLSLPLPFTLDLKLISFTNPFLHSHSYSFRTAFTDLNLHWIKGALALIVLVSGYVC